MWTTSRVGLALALCWLPAVAATYATTPEAFGAVGDGKVDDSDAIARAVASCRAHRTACKVRFANCEFTKVKPL